MTDDFLTLTQMDTGVQYLDHSDERVFFQWLASITCVGKFFGDGSRGLVVQLRHAPDDDELKQLLALCHRYGAKTRQLAKFETDANREWLHQPEAWWYAGLFGDAV
ncbi:hypothetical protein [Nitrospirillum sp. BR 11828]|uniref:hypothetical protein n=1 Tax=Nitrospirillum sp. BR 11828 TaxID=3104325 RepID=UPI002ACA798A|nr:hypothetical protein [Nitrospirillum sp. BR 11828]MDZ5646681.1 hypothetical protein [Nitrospirillum sp. BR 11828]